MDAWRKLYCRLGLQSKFKCQVTKEWPLSHWLTQNLPEHLQNQYVDPKKPAICHEIYDPFQLLFQLPSCEVWVFIILKNLLWFLCYHFQKFFRLTLTELLPMSREAKGSRQNTHKWGYLLISFCDRRKPKCVIHWWILTIDWVLTCSCTGGLWHCSGNSSGWL